MGDPNWTKRANRFASGNVELLWSRSDRPHTGTVLSLSAPGRGADTASSRVDVEPPCSGAGVGVDDDQRVGAGRRFVDDELVRTGTGHMRSGRQIVDLDWSRQNHNTTRVLPTDGAN